jgi:hypothetical protein
LGLKGFKKGRGMFDVIAAPAGLPSLVRANPDYL